MSDPSKLCIICNKRKTAKNKLINDPQMVKTLIDAVNDKIALGYNDFKPILLWYNNASVSEQKIVLYHSECWKPITNASNREYSHISHLKRSTTKSGTTEGLGNPSTSNEPMRPKRQKCEPKARVCIFSLCEFCKRKTPDTLYLIQSDNVGEKLLSIK